MTEALGINVLTTAAESPCSNERKKLEIVIGQISQQVFIKHDAFHMGVQVC